MEWENWKSVKNNIKAIKCFVQYHCTIIDTAFLAHTFYIFQMIVHFENYVGLDICLGLRMSKLDKRLLTVFYSNEESTHTDDDDDDVDETSD